MSSRFNQRYNQIGLDRLVRLKWLERSAYLFLAGNEAPAIKAALQEDLQRAFRSKNTTIRGSLDKTITILMKIWVRPPRDLQPLQREGLRLLSRLPREDHIAVHWGMAMAVYPFWGNVAAHVGRLLRLQGSVTHAQVRRRIMEQYGQRPTVKDAVRRVLRSMVDWGVLKDATTHDARRTDGTYVPGLSLAIAQVELIAWLAEALLHAHPNGSVALTTVLDSTSLFPFRLKPISADQLVAVSGRLEVLRHGLDQDLIMLRPASLPAAKGGGS